MELQISNIDDWWNLVQDLLQKDVHGLFDEHITYENSYRRKLKAYQKSLPRFCVHVSPSTTLEDSFATLDFDEFEVDTNE